MISKTKINERMKHKTKSELAEAIFIAKKNNLIEIANALSVPTRDHVSINLEKLDKETKEGEEVFVPGKILGQGEIGKKLKVYALGFSEQAKEKLKKAGCEFEEILSVLEKNKSLKARVLR